MRVTVDINPDHEFLMEFQCIDSQLHQEILLRALDKIPDYFWVIPSSTRRQVPP